LSSLFACVLLLQAAGPVEIVVAAASDLAPIEKQMRGLAPNVAIRFVFGSSGQLASQIRAGAPYDVFLSANLDIVRELESEGRLVVGTARSYARGRLALYSKSGQTDLSLAKAIAIANPAHAPYGVAAKQALQARADWAVVSKRIVYAENVRQALQFAESGNADVALVAWSLVKGKAGAVLLPESAHAPIVQGAGVVRGKAEDAERTGRAMAFVDALLGKVGQAMLREAGFSTTAAAAK
jgi:molybdate transport system substrate-binding protein